MAFTRALICRWSCRLLFRQKGLTADSGSIWTAKVFTWSRPSEGLGVVPQKVVYLLLNRPQPLTIGIFRGVEELPGVRQRGVPLRERPRAVGVGHHLVGAVRPLLLEQVTRQALVRGRGHRPPGKKLRHREHAGGSRGPPEGTAALRLPHAQLGHRGLACAGNDRRAIMP